MIQGTHRIGGLYALDLLSRAICTADLLCDWHWGHSSKHHTHGPGPSSQPWGVGSTGQGMDPVEDKGITCALATGPNAMEVMSREEPQNRRYCWAESVPLVSSTLSKGLSARTMEAWGAAHLRSFWKGPKIHPFFSAVLFALWKRIRGWNTKGLRSS